MTSFLLRYLGFAKFSGELKHSYLTAEQGCAARLHLGFIITNEVMGAKLKISASIQMKNQNLNWKTNCADLLWTRLRS